MITAIIIALMVVSVLIIVLMQYANVEGSTTDEEEETLFHPNAGIKIDDEEGKENSGAFSVVLYRKNAMVNGEAPKGAIFQGSAELVCRNLGITVSTKKAGQKLAKVLIGMSTMKANNLLYPINPKKRADWGTVDKLVKAYNDSEMSIDEVVDLINGAEEEGEEEEEEEGA